MKFVKFPFIFGALAVAAGAAHAQTILPQSHSYGGVDANGNRTVTTVQTPLAGASSAAGLIAQQGVLGARTTSSSTSTSLSFGSGSGFSASFGSQTYVGQPYGYYGNSNNVYCPPANGYYPGYGYPAAGYPTAGYPIAGYPIAGYPANGYGYPAVNNYYLPQSPYTIPLGPSYNPYATGSSITVFPLGTTYLPPGAPPLYPTNPFPGSYSQPNRPSYGGGYSNYPTRPTYPNYGTRTYVDGSFYTGVPGFAGVFGKSQSSGVNVGVGRGGFAGGFNRQNSSSSTTIRR